MKEGGRGAATTGGCSGGLPAKSRGEDARLPVSNRVSEGGGGSSHARHTFDVRSSALLAAAG